MGKGGKKKSKASSASEGSSKESGLNSLKSRQDAVKNLRQSPHFDKPPLQKVKRESMVPRYSRSQGWGSWIMEKLMLLVAILSIAGGMIVFLSAPVIRYFPSLAPHMFFLNNFPPITLSNFSNLNSFELNGENLFVESNGLKLGTWDVAPEGDIQNAIVLYCHGTSGHRAHAHRVGLYKVLSSMGIRTIAFDYRGYADSSSVQPWSEDELVSDVLLVDSWLRNKYGSTNPKIIYWGHSMGSGTCSKAAYIAQQSGKNVDALILEAPITNAKEILRRHVLLSPLRLSRDFVYAFSDALDQNGIVFDNRNNIRAITSPVLILHAEDDTQVPVDHGWQIYNAAKSRDGRLVAKLKTYEWDLGYGHNNMYLDENLPALLSTFLEGENSE